MNFKIIYLLISLIFGFYSSFVFSAVDKIPSFPDEMGPKTFDYATVERFKNNSDNVVVHGFSGDSVFRASRLQRSFFLKTPGPFHGNFLIGNFTGIKLKFNLFVFIDYKQQGFRVGNKKSTFHLVEIKKNSNLIIPIKLDRISYGAHDILVIAIRQDEDIRTKILSHRANIYVGDNGFDKVKFSKLPDLGENKDFNITISKNESIKLPGRYDAHVNNYYNTNMKYSIIVLLDSKQITVQSMYFEQDEKSRNVISMSVEEKYKNSELIAFVVDNPYSVLEPTRGVYSKVKSRVRVSNKIQ